ncbi:RES family NAD+ phosphorylase [Deinococcus sp. SL84]|uniref:RES family NAD+ phosphorylase n=1 Tax=Deinococcus sp. SL84 TaxID=2994663 RepID=UPI002272C018|nr:RES family NAD+ phosphorylase [Deinococcus sp. SL84]MCY1703961.1 RES family NAD+ phosphorylase [Deinococcus sp. SL84]
MSLTLYRLGKQQYLGSPLLSEYGVGAALYGGRWNSPDPVSLRRRVIYASDTLAQATLEVVVHADSQVLRTAAHGYVRFHVDEAAVADLDLSGLPNTWNALPGTPASQMIGDQWFDEQVSPVLRVPSVILPLDVYGPGQSNYLINPLHPDTERTVRFGGVWPYRFDPRL